MLITSPPAEPSWSLPFLYSLFFLTIHSCTCGSSGRTIPKGVNDSEPSLLQTDIFTFKVLPSCLCLTTEHHTDLQTTEDLHTSLHYHSTELPLTTQKSSSWEKEQEVWTRRLLIKLVPISIDNNVVLAATNWMACWMTLGEIHLRGLYRYMQKSHFACLCQLCVISLTHAIKDYLYWRITILNPVQLLHFENHALRSWPIMLNK